MWPAKEKGFMTFKRELPANVPVDERVKSFREFTTSLPEIRIREQAYRCMNCGVPFCHSGCPLANQIPDFNDALKNNHWREALAILHSTNNFPEITGRVCPAPCETSCVLGINEPPVAIEYIEREIVERGWREGWIAPQPPDKRTGKSVAIVGSGPAGLAAAQQLNRTGHDVTVFERDDEPGGLLMYGIPAFKLDKSILKRRLDQLRAEGVRFQCGAWIGKNVPVGELETFDAVLLTIGSTKARTLDIPGANLNGIHLAMDFLPQQTRRLLGKDIEGPEISARGKNVVVIGGGDTGSDCVGTAIRQGAAQVVSLEIMPRPPLERDPATPWPMWPYMLRTSSSHEEGGSRDWSVLTKEFLGENGTVRQLHCVRVEWIKDASGRMKMQEISGSDFRIDCDLALLALGFLHPEHDTVVRALELERDSRGNIKTESNFETSRSRVFAAGDARRGQSLVVWAIREGREAARCLDLALMGFSNLPSLASYGYDTLAG
ncbi:MAG TPA: glutamate synthase subunit beta [Candidatus Hydrogenedentes bacterium]|nr:glutamate synthase subunit beta [Candidatus Hydrogenedentota bacterium]HPC18273.1 glutamate synthase subunit beta [Candidatus Hydrogenedentota bacterium]HRT22011.1 glutamate synthase subunit beta [Candidatus Hydrogenedentota bacterium]HRT66706.1 glutamate synthase subunit beta [Candidatus Hydrogenedentota bacterium]